MNLSLGIVGLPNVGNSTLFNALTKNNVPAENYPFCTIDPNVGIVPVPDQRLGVLAEIAKSAKTVPAVIEFYDIAGLVKGAHKGEGLGNEFLGHIRSTDAIVHVVRSFASGKITHVENRIDPVADKETIETELILKDLDTIKKQITVLEPEAKRDEDKRKLLEIATKISSALDSGQLAITVPKPEDPEQKSWRKQLGLLTDKPVIFVVNGDFERYSPQLATDLRKQLGLDPMFQVVPMNIQQEFELAALTSAEFAEFKQEFGIEFSGLELLTRASYQLMNLISFFTAGEQEARAWTIEKGYTAPQAAGVIHTDFQHKFIAADVVTFEDFKELNGWQGARAKGKVRLEGKSYIVEDGDIMLFKHGA
jgi:GTP-binding protein YchF